MSKKTILEVQNLTKYFSTPKGMLHAVDGVNFAIEEGKTLGIVGESGCGKSTTGRTLLKLLEPTEGKIIFENEPDLLCTTPMERSIGCFLLSKALSPISHTTIPQCRLNVNL